MIKNINIINGEIQWFELVGLESSIKNYKIMCIGYNKINKILQIAEYRAERNYTNEIVTIDTDRVINILKLFNIEINLVEKFTWSNETLTKVRGLEQAGFTYLTYNLSNDEVLLNNEMNLIIFNDNEKRYIKNVYSKQYANVNNIINIQLTDIK